MGVLTPLVVQVILLVSMVKYGFTTYEPCQTFFQVFLLFVVADIGVADVVIVVLDNIVVVGSIVVVDVEVEQE